MKSFIVICLVFVSSVAFASPFIVCDPYPSSSPQPDSFTVVLNGTTYTSAPQAVSGQGVRLHFDIAGKWLSGANNATVKAVNMFGESSTSPLAFSAGVPAAPSLAGLEK